MRYSLLLVIIILSACKKEKIELISPAEAQSFYQSRGNLLILEIGDELEALYEFDFPNLQVDSDTLKLYYDLLPTVLMDPYIVWKMSPHDQVLFYQYQQQLTFLEERIDPSELERIPNASPYDSAQFHRVAGNTSIDSKEIWHRVGNLAILDFYRNQHPLRKMSLLRIVKQEYDEGLGFSVPVERHLLILGR